MKGNYKNDEATREVFNEDGFSGPAISGMSMPTIPEERAG
jgi:hypothetical protein